MNCYETLFVIKPTLTEEEIKGQIARVKEIVAEEGGEIKAIDDMGMRRLAYPIEKQERGYYSVIYCTAPSELVGELERQLRYNEEVLRFMTVKYTNKKELGVFEKMVEKTNGRNTTPSEEKGETPAETETAAEEATAEGTEA